MKANSKRKILVISAMDEEMAPLIQRFCESVPSVQKGRVIETTINESTVYFFITGIGRKSVEKQLLGVEDIVRSVDCVLLIGICGAIDKKLKVGDIVIPDKIVSSAGEDLLIDETMRAYALTDAFQKNIYCGGILLTGDKLFTLSEKRNMCALRPDARIVDMEAYCIGEYLKRERVPLSIVKSVSDRFDFLFPEEKFLVENFNVKRIKRKINLLFHRPSESIKLFLLKRNIAKAVATNVRYVASVIKSMV